MKKHLSDHWVQAPSQHHQIFWKNTLWHGPALGALEQKLPLQHLLIPPGQGNTAQDKATLLGWRNSPVHLPVRVKLVWNWELHKNQPKDCVCPSRGIPSSWDCGRATRVSLDLSLPHHLFLLIPIFPTVLGSIQLAEHGLGSFSCSGERWGYVEICPPDGIPAVDQQPQFNLCLIQKKTTSDINRRFLGLRTNKARNLKTSKHYFPLKEHWKKSRLYLNKCYTTFFIIFTSQQTLKGEIRFSSFKSTKWKRHSDHSIYRQEGSTEQSLNIKQLKQKSEKQYITVTLSH